MTRFFDLLRIVLGNLYILATGVNLYLALWMPQVYQGWSESAILPFYHDFMVNVQMPYLQWIVFFFSVHQLMVGLLILHQGQAVHNGLMGAIIFHLLVVPWGVGLIPNLLLIVLLLVMLPRSYSNSLLPEFARQFV
jgi:hypothetical protein